MKKTKIIFSLLIMLVSFLVSCDREEANSNEQTFSTEEMYYNQTIRLSFRNNLGVAIINRDFTWKSSNEAVAKVTQEGYITAIGIGEATITATEKSTGNKYIQKIIVKPLQFTITPQLKELHYNDTFIYSVETQKSNSIDNNKLLNWSVSDNKIGTIDEYGEFRAKRIGSTEVTAVDKVTNKSYKMQVVVKPIEKDFTLVTTGFGQSKNYIKINEKRSLTSETENTLVYQTPVNDYGISIIRKVEYQFENNLLKSIVVTFDPTKQDRIEHYYRERYNLLEENYTYDYIKQSYKYWKIFLDDTNLKIHYQRYEEIRQFTNTEITVTYTKS